MPTTTAIKNLISMFHTKEWKLFFLYQMAMLWKDLLKLVQAWLEIHCDELMADWELAINGQKPYKIEPLR